MRKTLLLTLLSLIGFTLFGCAHREPQIFGMPESQWTTLTPEQQEAIVDKYNPGSNS